jgi:hypothetical protein
MRPKSEAEGDRGELTCDGAPFELRCGGNLLAVEQRLGPRDRSSEPEDERSTEVPRRHVLLDINASAESFESVCPL